MTEIAKMIDHTLLKPESTKEQIVQLCKEARQYGFATVCINPTWVSTAAQELEDFDVGITTVIGFPLGATTSFTKVAETRDAIANGATEIEDRKSTRLNSSHVATSYAVFCLKKT